MELKITSPNFIGLVNLRPGQRCQYLVDRDLVVSVANSQGCAFFSDRKSIPVRNLKAHLDDKDVMPGICEFPLACPEWSQPKVPIRIDDHHYMIHDDQHLFDDDDTTFVWDSPVPPTAASVDIHTYSTGVDQISNISWVPDEIQVDIEEEQNVRYRFKYDIKVSSTCGDILGLIHLTPGQLVRFQVVTPSLVVDRIANKQGIVLLGKYCALPFQNCVYSPLHILSDELIEESNLFCSPYHTPRDDIVDYLFDEEYAIRFLRGVFGVERWRYVLRLPRPPPPQPPRLPLYRYDEDEKCCCIVS